MRNYKNTFLELFTLYGDLSTISVTANCCRYSFLEAINRITIIYDPGKYQTAIKKKHIFIKRMANWFFTIDSIKGNNYWTDEKEMCTGGKKPCSGHRHDL